MADYVESVSSFIHPVALMMELLIRDLLSVLL